jgi:hypothetical protein
MSNPPFFNARLVQKRITSYFPVYSEHCSSTDLCSELDSLLPSTDNYVSETPKSKQGFLGFYLGLCNSIENSHIRVVKSSEVLFELAASGGEEPETLNHSPTPTCESVTHRK